MLYIGQCIAHLFSISIVVIIVSVCHVCVDGAIGTDALGLSASLVLLVHAGRELVPLVLLAPDACGLLALLVLLVPAVGGSFTLVVCFQVFCPSLPATDLASLLPSCLRFLAGVHFMVDMILVASVVVLLLLCASVWFFVVVVGC